MNSEIPNPTYSQDEEQLRLLQIFHKVLAGIYGVFGLCGFPHFIIGLMLIINPKAMSSSGGGAGDAFTGGIFAFAGLVFILFAWTLGVLSWMAAGRIAQRRGLKFLYVASGLNCLWMPFGTALGVFTLVVLTRPTVRVQFPD